MRHEQAGETRADNEAKFDPQGLRDRLMARRSTVIESQT